MSDMIERVAIALRRASPKAGRRAARDGDLVSQELGYLVCMDLARAAIEAMRDPTPAMKAAIASAVGNYDIGHEGWHRGIDAALSPANRAEP